MAYPSEHEFLNLLVVLHAALRVQEVLPFVQRLAPGDIWPGPELHALDGQTKTRIDSSAGVRASRINPSVYSYAGDEFEPGLVVRLRRQAEILSAP